MEVSDTLAYYINLFKKIRVNKTKAKGESPHKPILLLAVMDGFENDFLNSQIIEISPELVAAFKARWAELVKENHHRPRFSLPFFHLKSAKFWHLIPNHGYEKILNQSRIASFLQLKQSIQYALIDEELFLLLNHKASREILKKVLLKRYFPSSQYLKDGTQLFIDFENQILEENNIPYSLSNTEDEEQNFIRSGFFKKVVPRIYQYKCCISDLSISATANISMIDACHIIPFSVSQNDKITNGISLCPNLHRAFDRGLISIDDNYKVIVSKVFIENNYSPYNIKMFENKEINLPSNSNYYPSLASLEWHRTHKFLQ